LAREQFNALKASNPDYAKKKVEELLNEGKGVTPIVPPTPPVSVIGSLRWSDEADERV
jgi:hypothetical protein